MMSLLSLNLFTEESSKIPCKIKTIGSKPTPVKFKMMSDRLHLNESNAKLYKIGFICMSRFDFLTIKETYHIARKVTVNPLHLDFCPALEKKILLLKKKGLKKKERFS